MTTTGKDEQQVLIKSCIVTRESTSKSEWGIRVEIKDQGPGMQKDSATKFFTSLLPGNVYQANAEGYSIIINKKIVDMHKGRIGVHSEGPGKGATFFVDMPSRLPQSRRNSGVSGVIVTSSLSV